MSLTEREGVSFPLRLVENAAKMATSEEKCKPDYQGMAVAVAKKLAGINDFLEALDRAIEAGTIPYELKNNSFNIYELNGFLDFSRKQLVREYEKLLKKIEEEKADGSK
jgi:hypothetical protein